MKAAAALFALTLTACAAPPASAPASAGTTLPRITPVPDSYACGAQNFKVAFEEGVVSVISQFDGLMIEFSDGSRCGIGSSETLERAKNRS